MVNMMDDLISRQAAMDALRAAYWDKNIQSAKDDPCIVDAMTDLAIRKIKGLPAIQNIAALPVVHGEWVHDGYDFPHGVDWMHCSNCGRRDVYCPAARTNYCPNCGARMDGYETES